MWDGQGRIYSWGDASEGKLGHPCKDQGFNYIIIEPVKIRALETNSIIMATCGNSHSLALTAKGEIFTWGRSFYD